MRKKYIVLVVICLLLILYLGALRPWYNVKKVHVSIDDVAICLKDLNDNKDKYSSLFEQPFFSYLKKCHDYYGVKFTLYTYEQYKGFNISCLTNKYKGEFINNSDWLKLGYHAKSDLTTKDSIANLLFFISSFKKTKRSIEYSIGSCASMLRLHFYFATQTEIDSLKNLGVSSLLSSDDERVSYSLPIRYNDSLLVSESLDFDGVHYEKTDIRVENTLNPLYSLWENRNDDFLSIFTHEWALSSTSSKIKFSCYLLFLSLYKSNFVIY